MTNGYYSYRFDTICNGVFTSLSSNAHGSSRKNYKSHFGPNLRLRMNCLGPKKALNWRCQNPYWDLYMGIIP